MHHVMFCHSVRSDWNHGNAHFLRGLAAEALRRGDGFDVHEPADGWSARNLVQEHGPEALQGYNRAYPDLHPRLYAGVPDVAAAVEDADIVLVHEWTDPKVVDAITAHHADAGNYGLYFHDSHHRALSAPDQIEALGIDRFDGVLAFGEALRERYLEQGWTDRAWTWHEAADPHVFQPLPPPGRRKDIVWIGNWGDEERTQELEEFLIEPVKRLGLEGTVHGVRYPAAAQARLAEAGLDHRGWIANTHVPMAFAAHRVTVHVPRRPYLDMLPGIPTIRMFEAFAAGIPLAVARWHDTEGLFTEGHDYLRADDGEEMEAVLRRLLDEPEEARRMAEHARQTILDRHTCGHRLNELQAIHGRLAPVRGGGSRHIAFFGSSLVSSYWNGAATYYRGLLGALSRLGHRISFFEPAAYERHDHQDIEPPAWADVTIYDASGTEGVRSALESARAADVIVKASGVGAHDELLEEEVLKLQEEGRRVFYWDVDAPATLERLASDPQDPLRRHLPRYDGIFTYGGGPRVVQEYTEMGARQCIPIYNAVDPSTHHPERASPLWQVDLAFLGNRLPDREERVHEFFLRPAASMPDKRFLLGGAGWQPEQLPPNVTYTGHVGTKQHNRFNCSPLAVLNINRRSMADYGHSPATRIFEAAGAGACIITDAWKGIEDFLEPDKEILVAQDGKDVCRILQELDPGRAQAIGHAARRRVLRDHTYSHRAMQVHAELGRLREVLA